MYTKHKRGLRPGPCGTQAKIYFQPQKQDFSPSVYTEKSVSRNTIWHPEASTFGQMLSRKIEFSIPYSLK